MKHFFIICSGNASLIDAYNETFEVGAIVYGGKSEKYHTRKESLEKAIMEAQELSIQFNGQRYLGSEIKPISQMDDILKNLIISVRQEIFLAYVAVDQTGVSWVEGRYNARLKKAISQGILPFEMYSTTDEESISYILNLFNDHKDKDESVSSEEMDSSKQLAIWKENAEKLVKEGRYSNAIEYYNMILKSNHYKNTNGYYDYLKGCALMKLDRYEESVTCLKYALQVDSEGDSYRYELGIALYELGRLQEAYSTFQKLAPFSNVWGLDKKAKEWMTKIKDEIDFKKNTATKSKDKSPWWKFW